MSPESQKQIVFLLYDSRSGSTLFSALLNRYASICVSHESAFISRTIEYRREIRTKNDIPALVEYLYQEVQFSELGIPRHELENELVAQNFPISKKALASALLHFYFQRRDPDADVWVVKDHPYRHIQTLQEYFPRVKFLHIIRDGRAVYYSRKNAVSIDGRPMDVNLLKAALRWRARVSIAQKHPDVIYKLRYEDLITNSKSTLDKVLDFLQITPQGRVLSRTQADYSRAIGDRQKHLHTHAGTSPDEIKIHGWKSGLDKVDTYLYERLNGKWLCLYGYSLIASSQLHPATFYLAVCLRFISCVLQFVYLYCLSLAMRIKRRLQRGLL